MHNSFDQFKFLSDQTTDLTMDIIAFKLVKDNVDLSTFV